MCTCPQGCAVNPISRSWIYSSSIDLRLRTGFNSAYGTFWSTHNSGHSFTFASAFHSNLGAAPFGQLNGHKAVDWVGSAGAGGFCDDKPYHSQGRAFDVTRVTFTNGSSVCCRGSWEVAEAGNNRGYAAVLAACRIFLGPGGVLGAGYSGHGDHIHIDDMHGGPQPFSTSSAADRVILRRINRVFGGSSIAVNQNSWTTSDTNATNSTLAQFGFAPCYNIFSNVWYTIGYLDKVIKHGVNNKPAGYYPALAC